MSHMKKQPRSRKKAADSSTPSVELRKGLDGVWVPVAPGAAPPTPPSAPAPSRASAISREAAVTKRPPAPVTARGASDGVLPRHKVRIQRAASVHHGVCPTCGYERTLRPVALPVAGKQFQVLVCVQCEKIGTGGIELLRRVFKF